MLENIYVGKNLCVTVSHQHTITHKSSCPQSERSSINSSSGQEKSLGRMRKLKLAKENSKFCTLPLEYKKLKTETEERKEHFEKIQDALTGYMSTMGKFSCYFISLFNCVIAFHLL